MKNLIFFATLLIFILNISDNVIVAEVKDEVHDPVLDLDGKELQTETSYYLTPIFRPGGGVTIYPLANETRTYGIAQLALFGVGLPVTFSNRVTDEGDQVVRESTDLSIAFSPGMLYYPAVWIVDEYDEAAEQYFVTAGDIDVNENSNNTWFQIRKGSLGGYSFVFCPKDTQICINVGIVAYEGVRRFALGGNFPSTFWFNKFESGTNGNHLEA